MKTIGEYIGPYRILWLAQTSGNSEDYVVERSNQPGNTFFLQFWPSLKITDETRFLSQMQSLQRLQEPFLLSLVDFGTTDNGSPYLVFPQQRMSMEPFGEFAGKQTVKEELARTILSKVGAVLARAHGQGVIHGFFSPASLIFTPEGNVRVCSFLSSGLDAASAQAVLPEQYRFPESVVSRLSDQYALAGLAQDLLFAGDPLPANTEELRQTINRARSPRPDERFASVRDFLGALGITLPFAAELRESGDPVEYPENPSWKEATQQDATEPFASSPFHATAQREAEPGAGTYASPPPPFSTTSRSQQTRKRTGSQRGCLATLISIALIVLIILLHIVLPASSAKVTIAPVDQQLHQTYELQEGPTTNLDAKQFGGRALTYTTGEHKTSTDVKNTTHIEGTAASGTVVFSQISSTIYLDLYDLSINVNDNVTLLVDDKTTTMEPGNTYTIPVHAENNGTAGNLPAGAVDGDYQFLTSGATAYISNPDPITGGVDDYDGPVVSTTDVGLTESNFLTQEEQEARTYFQSQLKPGEALLDNLSCDQTNTLDPPLNSRAANVTISSTASCSMEAYNQDQLDTALLDAAHKTALTQFDPHFALLHPAKITLTNSGQASTTGAKDVIELNVDSTWRLLLDARGRQAVQQALTGLSQDDALALLRNHYKSRTSSLQLSWFWGGHLPIDPQAIQIEAHYLTT